MLPLQKALSHPGWGVRGCVLGAPELHTSLIPTAPSFLRISSFLRTPHSPGDHGCGTGSLESVSQGETWALVFVLLFVPWLPEHCFFLLWLL